jgi:hypothetical protein
MSKKNPEIPLSIYLFLVYKSPPLRNKQDFLEVYFPHLKLAKIYLPGESFGEISLMTQCRR